MLTVEDGTGLANADSYVNATDCAAYAAAHGLTFTDDSAAQEAALRNATQYLDGAYRFSGSRLSESQSLAWPRTVADGLPREIVAACCELAVRASIAPLWADVAPTDAIIEQTVGPITTRYSDPGPAPGQTEYAAVTALLRRWIAAPGIVKLMRV